MAKSLNTNGGPYENRTRLSRLKSRTQLNDFKAHSDSSRHVHAVARQSLKPGVRTARPNDLCVECGHRPRAAGGQLSRCIPCIKVEAARARDARKASDARISKMKTSKPRSPQRTETA